MAGKETGGGEGEMKEKPSAMIPPGKHPSIPEVPKQCEHDFQFLRTEFESVEGTYNNYHSQTDVFFCRKCLKYERLLARVENERGRPNWYKP